MDKRVYNAVMDRAEGYCEVCKQGGNLELHHILRRKVKESKHNCIALCPECHRGTYGVHGKNGHELDLKLKILVQHRYFKMGFDENEIREMLGGKLYDTCD